MDPILGALSTARAGQLPGVEKAGAAAGAGGTFPQDADGADFGETFRRVIGEVSELEQDSHDAIRAFLNGEPVELHQVMAAVEEAGIALDMLVELRNKLAEAYHTVTNMQN